MSYRVNEVVIPSYIEYKPEELEYYLKRIKRSGYSLTEDSLSQAIKENKSKSVVYYAAMLLKEYGTTKSIPLLKSLSSYPNIDVKVVALTSIGVIAGGRESEYYASLLEDSRYKIKDYAILIIAEAGNEKALPSVKRYAKKILQGRIKLNSWPPIQLPIIHYFRRVGDDEAKELANRLSELPIETYKTMSKEDWEETKKELGELFK